MIIEAIIENLEIKQALMHKIDAIRAPMTAIDMTMTSGPTSGFW